MTTEYRCHYCREYFPPGAQHDCEAARRVIHEKNVALFAATIGSTRNARRLMAKAEKRKKKR